MLQVKTPEEVLEIIRNEFAPMDLPSEPISLYLSHGRILASDLSGREYVPDFDRSTVDGYAVRSSDTFGCSESIPAVLTLKEKIPMGSSPVFPLSKECCSYIPTGGKLPENADCVIMQEYTEDYGDGTVGMMKAGAPGDNVIFRGDDTRPGKVILKKGRRLSSRDIGVLAALGITKVPAVPKLKVGILSTGDELVPPEEPVSDGQIRDINSAMLASLFSAWGADVRLYGIIKDEEALLLQKLSEALPDCDAVIISGGSSAGEKDACARCMETIGEILLHGIAIKPGKPTIIGRAGQKPLIGLPGHPAAAWLIAKLFVIPLFDRLAGIDKAFYPVRAKLTENVAANHGRAYVCACRLEKDETGFLAHPVRSKSGLITSLSQSDGFFYVERDCEGLAGNTEINVFLYEDR